MKANVPKGMGGGPQNMQGMMRQVQKMQEEMTAKQAELEVKEYTVKTGGGAVEIKINGKKEVLSMAISPDLVDPDDIETLTDVVIAAVNEAIKTVEKDYQEQMERITGNSGLGGLGGLGFPGAF